MPDSGVTHELTAVLLNFRAFDTFLEIAVLTLAAVIGLALQAGQPEPPLQPVDNPLLRALVTWCGPAMLLLAVYLFWAGSKEPGGAFQAGALLAAAGLLLRLSGTALPLPGRAAGLRLAMIAGLAVFLLAALLGPILGLPLFSFPPAIAGPLIFGIEAVLALSIAITLLSLYNAAPPGQGGRQ